MCCIVVFITFQFGQPFTWHLWVSTGFFFGLEGGDPFFHSLAELQLVLVNNVVSHLHAFYFFLSCSMWIFIWSFVCLSRPNTHWNPSLCWSKVLQLWGTQAACSWRAPKVYYDASLLWSSCWVIWADLHIPIRCCQEADAGIAYYNPFTLLVAINVSMNHGLSSW